MKNRIVAGVLLIVLCMTVMVGCSEKKQCSVCGQVKSGKSKTVWGEKIFICNDCAKEINSLFK